MFCPLTLSMPTFLKEFCNALKLPMYSCSSLVANLTRFSTRHPRKRGKKGERERERDRRNRQKKRERDRREGDREREQAGRKGRVIGANGGNYRTISVVTWKQQIHELAVNSSCVCIAHTHYQNQTTHTLSKCQASVHYVQSTVQEEHAS